MDFVASSVVPFDASSVIVLFRVMLVFGLNYGDTMNMCVNVMAVSPEEAKKRATEIFSTDYEAKDYIVQALCASTMTDCRSSDKSLNIRDFSKWYDNNGISFAEYFQAQVNKLSESDIDDLIHKGSGYGRGYRGEEGYEYTLHPYEVNSNFGDIFDYVVKAENPDELLKPIYGKCVYKSNNCNDIEICYNADIVSLIVEWMHTFIIKSLDVNDITELLQQLIKTNPYLFRVTPVSIGKIDMDIEKPSDW